MQVFREYKYLLCSSGSHGEGHPQQLNRALNVNILRSWTYFHCYYSCKNMTRGWILLLFFHDECLWHKIPPSTSMQTKAGEESVVVNGQWSLLQIRICNYLMNDDRTSRTVCCTQVADTVAKNNLLWMKSLTFFLPTHLLLIKHRCLQAMRSWRVLIVV